MGGNFLGVTRKIEDKNKLSNILIDKKQAIYKRGDFRRPNVNSRRSRDFINWESGYRIANLLVNYNGSNKEYKEKSDKNKKFILKFYQEYIFNLLNIIIIEVGAKHIIKNFIDILKKKV